LINSTGIEEMWLYLGFVGLLTLTLVIWLVIALLDQADE